MWVLPEIVVLAETETSVNEKIMNP